MLTVTMAAATTAQAGVYSWECKFPGFRGTILTYVWDTDKKSASMVGNNGAAALWPHIGRSVVSGQAIVSFSEPVPNGIIQTTTIIIDSGEAVHSRHTIVGGKFAASQDFGSCLQKQ